MDYFEQAKIIINKQAESLKILANSIPKDFPLLVNYILKMQGRVILVGMGKSGYIARKIASSLASTGTPAFFVHPGEASHGDLGMITKSDLVTMLSNSGETKELFDTINYCKKHNIKIVAITMKSSSTLAQSCNFLLNLPLQKEVSEIGAPSTSTIMSLSLGDALVTALHDARNFSKENFKIFHPGGKIGINLLKAIDIIKKDQELPIVSQDKSIFDVIIQIVQQCKRCVVVTDNKQQVIGIITSRNLKNTIKSNLNEINIIDLMDKDPLCVESSMLASEVLKLMHNQKTTIAPVVNGNKLLGIIHIEDIINAGLD